MPTGRLVASGSACHRPRLDPRQALPLWAQLSSLLRERLLAGVYSERFPTEADLTAEFEVSRATVREAIRRLREEGLLDARRGSGTFVVRRRLGEPVIGAPGLARAIVAAGLEEESRVLVAAELPATAEVAAALGVASGEPIVWLERLRVAGGEPLALDRPLFAWKSGAAARCWAPTSDTVRSTSCSPPAATSPSPGPPAPGAPRHLQRPLPITPAARPG